MRALPVPGADGEMEMKEMTKLECRIPKEDRKAFTLMELLVVIAIIAVLLGLAFPVFQGVLDRAKKVQTKNDLTQIVTAVNAFYTEYGKYPVNVASGNTTDAFFGTGTTPTGDTSYGNNDVLIDVLRNNTTGPNSATVATWNPRATVYIQPPISKTGTKGGVTSTTGIWYDPFGSPYNVMIDGSYDNNLTNPYTSDPSPPGGATLYLGVIVWSFGKNGALGGGAAAPGFSATENGTANKFTNSGDVISWQ